MKNRLCSNIVAKTWYLFLLILILHFVTGMIPTSSSSNFEVNSLSLRQTISGSTQIIGNQEFLEFAEEYGLDGNGSQDNPFILSNFDFVRYEEVIEPRFIPLLHLESISYFIEITQISIEDRAINGSGSSCVPSIETCFETFSLWFNHVSNLVLHNSIFDSRFDIFMQGENITLFNNEFAGGTDLSLIGNNIKLVDNSQSCDLTQEEILNINNLIEQQDIGRRLGHWSISGAYNLISQNCIGDLYGIDMKTNNSIFEYNSIPRLFAPLTTFSILIDSGIGLTGSNNIVQGNDIKTDVISISLSGESNIIFNNEISTGTTRPIEFIGTGQPSIAIHLNSANNSVIIGNLVSDSNGYGVSLQGVGRGWRSTSPTTHAQIIYNNFRNNTDYEYSDLVPFASQAFDRYAISNFTNNYWDDHSNNDANLDGFADDPYPIINNTDNEPLVDQILFDDDRIVEFLNQHPIYHSLNNLIDRSVDVSDPESERLVLGEDVRFVIGIVIGVIGVSALGYFTYQYSTMRTIGSLKVNELTRKNLKRMFNGRTKEFLLLANSVLRPDKGYTSGTKIPDKIFEYKFLMHPVRLSMMKLLIENPIPTSSEVKARLNLSWGEFSNHLRTMKKSNYIDTKDQFVEGKRQQVIIATEGGIAKYNELTTILNEFLNSQDVDSYLEDAKTIVNQGDESIDTQ